MLKVLQINVVAQNDSTGRTTREMHNYFLNHNIDSYIATANDQDSPDSFHITNNFFKKIDAIFTLITGLESYCSVIQTYRLTKWIDKISPDIVHLRNLHQNYLSLGILLRFLARKNICTVITLHDLWYVTGKCPYFHIHNCNKWKDGCNQCPSIRSDHRKRLFDRTNKMWRDKKKWLTSIKRLAVIGNSEWTASIAKESFLRDVPILDCIYNWIDFNVFYPRETRELRSKLNLNNKKVIIAVATFWNIAGIKGLSSYLQLANTMPDDYHILLIGKLTSQISIPDGITFIPEISDPNVLAEYYSLADVYLNLSRGESFGKAAAESICCGTPLVALDNSANKEIVPPGAGLVIKSDTPQEILQSLKTIFEKSKPEYTNACLKHAKQHFDKETNINQYLKVYNRLIGTK